VHEHIFAAIIRGDEAEAFHIVEKFNCSCCHCLF
jgi:hypothetical protein